MAAKDAGSALPGFVRLTGAAWDRIRGALFPGCGREHKLYTWLGRTAGGVTVSRLAVPGEDAYAFRSPVSVILEPRYMMGLLLDCEMDRPYGVLEIHCHPFEEQSRFSAIDDRWIHGVRRAFERDNPGCLFLRAVMGRAEPGFSLEAFDPGAGAWAPVPEFHVVSGTGSRRVRSVFADGNDHCNAPPASWNETYQRTAMARTPGEDARIATARVAVVGAGGLGWEVARGLAAIGIRDISLIDADRIETANLNRLIEATPYDAVRGTPKVDRLGALLRAHDPHRRVRRIREDFPGPRSVAEIQRSDLVITCVDRDPARFQVLRLCVRHLVPAIDCGTAIAMDPATGREASRNGHVWLYRPGSGCCWVQMGLSGSSLWSESLQSAQRAAGYVIGAEPGPAPPSVQTINSFTASTAVALAESWLAGRAPERNMILLSQTHRPEFDVTSHAVTARGNDDCPLCGKDGLEGWGGNPFEENATEPSLVPAIPDIVPSATSDETADPGETDEPMALAAHATIALESASGA